jgi:hypothetical protein
MRDIKREENILQIHNLCNKDQQLQFQKLSADNSEMP